MQEGKVFVSSVLANNFPPQVTVGNHGEREKLERKSGGNRGLVGPSHEGS